MNWILYCSPKHWLGWSLERSENSILKKRHDEGTVNAFLLALDFSAISRDALKYCIVPRVEPLSRTLAFTIHSMMNDASNNPVQTRCIFSARILEPTRVKVLPCCGVLIDSSSWFCRQRQEPMQHTVRRLRDHHWFFACPFCVGTPIRKKEGDFFFFSVSVEEDDKIAERYVWLLSYRENKKLRAEALESFALSSMGKNEIVLPTSGDATRKRKRSSGLVRLSPREGMAARILDNCGPLGSDRIFVSEVKSLSAKITDTLGSFCEKAFLGPPPSSNLHGRAVGSCFLFLNHGERLGFDNDSTWERSEINLSDLAQRGLEYDIEVRRAQSGC